jgi:DNA repair protein RecO (recombination protein O)
LARLIHAESVDTAPQLTGDRLMAAFYVNELLLKLTPRNDAAQPLFDLYARIRSELAGGDSLSWMLRRFERDLLDALGVGLPWDQSSDGETVEAGMRYRLDPEIGPVAQMRGLADSLGGETLLALAADRKPTAQQLVELRRALRSVLGSHLGPGGLRSWGLLDELARVKPRVQA